MDIKVSSPVGMPSKNLKSPQKTLKERAAVSLKSHQEGFIEDKLNEDLKNAIQDILYDLMHGGDVKSATLAVKSNKLIDGIEFTKRALLFGIERQAYEMELISRVLSSCFDIFNDNEIVDGFQLILFRLPDIVLDVPHAPSILSKFISRAIYDEIIPPRFVKDAHVDNVKAKECMSLVFAKTHALEETKEGLEHIWGPGDLSSVKDLKIAVDALLEEYLENPDIKESTKSFVELKVPSFFGEIIKRGLFKSIGMNEKARQDFVKLVEHWFQINVVSEGNIKRGFSMAYSQLDDLKLDVPTAGKLLPALQEVAVEKKLLPPHFTPVQTL